MHISSSDLLSDVTLDELHILIDLNPYLRGYLQGYLAEMKLAQTLRQVEGVTAVEKIPDSKEDVRGDLLVTYRGVDLTVEVKSVSSYGVKEDLMNGAWTGKVVNKRTSRKGQTTATVSDHVSTHVLAKSFDGIAICTFSATKTWDYFFLPELFIPRTGFDYDLLKTQFEVNAMNTPGLITDPKSFLDRLFELKSAHDQLDRRTDCFELDQLLQGSGLERDWCSGQPDFQQPVCTDES